MSENPRHLWLAIDQGTSSTRATLFDARGRVVNSARERVGLQRIDESRVEQDPREILASVASVLCTVVDDLEPQDTITAAGIATQRSSVVAFRRRDGSPLSPVLSWQDTRQRSVIEKMTSEDAREVHVRTGLPLTPHYGASKIEWLLTQSPKVQALIKQDGPDELCVAPLVTFLIHHLVARGPTVVDHANAGRTQLMRLETLEWDDWLLDKFGILAEFKVVLPEIVPTSHRIGTLNPLIGDVAPAHVRSAKLGKLESVPLVVSQGDQTAAFYGFNGGEGRSSTASQRVQVNLGTGGFVLAEWPVSTADKSRPEGLLCSVAKSTDKGIAFVLEGTVNGAGAAITWAMKELGISIDGPPPVDEWFASAAGVIESDEMPLFLNTVGGVGSPLWKTGRSATWVDQSGTEIQPDPNVAMAAVVESILFLVRLNLDTMRSSGLEVGWIGVSGGLAKSGEACQSLASLTECKVSRSDVPEATSKGVALLAAEVQGLCGDWDVVRAENFQPDESKNPLTQRYDTFIQLMLKL